MSTLRLAATLVVAAAAAGSAGATVTPSISRPLLAFNLGGLCATDLRGHMFRVTDTNLTDPAWSPDGRSIAYTRFNPSAERLSVFVADSQGRIRRSWNLGLASSGPPVWSSDGSKLALALQRPLYFTSLLILNVHDGGRASVGGRGSFAAPSWSPDGSRILFSKSPAEIPSDSATYVVDANGANERLLLNSAASAVWSPDGRQIAYAVIAGDGKRIGLAVARSDGSDQRPLTEGDVWAPAWSPDGGTIAFRKEEMTAFRVAVIRPDGTGERTVATGSAPRFRPVPAPAWSPDGGRIAFTRYATPSARSRVAVVRRDGTSEQTIPVPAGLAAYDPTWRSAPLPSRRRPCVVEGTSGVDVIRGTDKGDVISGGAGADTVYAGAGVDVILGGPGADTIYGGAGRDWIVGGSGRDRLRGGPDRDAFKARDRMRDDVNGGSGNDYGYVDEGLDRLTSIED